MEIIREQQKKLYKQRFINEFEHTDDVERKEQLRRIINHLENEERENNKTIHAEIDELVYKKEWERLKPFHKLEKIKEFLKDKNLLNDELLNKFTKLLRQNRLKKNVVIYDPQKQKIMRITILKIDKDNADLVV